MSALVVKARATTTLDGVLNLNKPPDWTSHDVVAKLRAALGRVKVGHAGTLDPAATGVLPILIGRATRIAEYLVDWEKEYDAVLRLGETTDTQDATGVVLSRHSLTRIQPHDVRAVMGRFVGTVTQIPPMYSAVKVDGVPLYKSARAGKTVERSPRPVTIYDLQVIGIQGSDVTFRVHCSKGTYVRALCADIGEVLGVGGHLLRLQRTRVGPLHVKDALSIGDAVEAIQSGRLAPSLLSLNDALGQLPALTMGPDEAARARHGAPVPVDASAAGTCEPAGRGRTGAAVRLLDEMGALIGLGLLAGTEGANRFVKITKVLAGATGDGAQSDATPVVR